ncbi:unnamed protein product [Lactuca virosa]|uniref:RRM domain-containing protein n=1 Tax=Lactuca virosa TaxID=75947 RepID=A0AAU9MGS2_9ASTR|nr:unnamed protein product [Lactuca virosa]
MSGHPPNGEWKEVRRRQKPNQRVGENEVLTSYYVVGFPKGIRKAELRFPFARFGTVADVYFADKLNAQRKDFAFVRFKDVEDERKLEVRLQGIKCRNKTLEVNLSKHPRKPMQSHGDDNRVRQKQGIGKASPQVWRKRDHRSFAHVAAGFPGQPPNLSPPPINLNPNTYMSEWLKKKVC